MDQSGDQPWEYRLRKYLLLLATLVVTVTYAAGFNPPGGNWQEGARDGRLAGDPIIRDTYYQRYLAFFYCNATAFAASLVVIVLILILAVQHDKQGKDKENAIWVASEVKPLRAVMVLDLLSLVGAYTAGTCRDKISTVYSTVLVAAAFIYIVVLKLMDHKKMEEKEAHKKMKAEERLRKVLMLLATFAVSITYVAGLSTPGGFWDSTEGSHRPGEAILKEHHSLRLTVFLPQKDKQDNAEDRLLEKRRKRLLLFAILAATITYQAGLTPPGGFLLQDNEFGNHAGDPVLLYNYPRRYNAFFYCNSVSFMLSIALIILLVNPNLYRPAIRSNALSVCTAVGLFCLMGAYAAGSTQHLKTSIYIFVLMAVVLFVVAVLLLLFLLRASALSRHIEKEGKEKENKNGNSAAAESSIAIEQEGKEEENKNGNLAAAESCISIEQDGKEEVNKNGISAAAESCIPIEQEDKEPVEHEDKEKRKAEEGRKHARRKYLMLLGILVASVAYQAGLEPPGGAWQSSRDGYEAGHPVMHDNRRPQYLAFFYSNSISFMASIVVIIMLLPHWLPNKEKEPSSEEKKKEPSSEEKKDWEEWSLKVMNKTILLDLAALLGAYAAGSSRGWKTSVYVIALIVAVLGYFAIHMKLSKCSERHHKAAKGTQSA